MSELVRRAQAGVEALKSIAKELKLFNENFAIFVKYLKESDETYDKTMREKGDMFSLVPRDQEPRPLVGFPARYVPTEGYAAGAPDFKEEPRHTCEEWMIELDRGWIYKDDAKLVDPDRKYTKDEFFHLVNTHGEEVTAKFMKEGE